MQTTTSTSAGDPAYGLTLRMGKTPLDEARARVTAALAAEGFGILTEIDVQATLEKKLGKKTAPYLILGACNPVLADRAIAAEPGIGLLLPCNVVVRQDGDETVVSIADPKAMFSVVANPAAAPIAGEAAERLQRVLAALAKS